jgi:hypothetical protein
VLASNPSFAGAQFFKNLLLLSADADSRRLLKVTRNDTLVSSFDFAGLQIQTIEGVTLDR